MINLIKFCMGGFLWLRFGRALLDSMTLTTAVTSDRKRWYCFKKVETLYCFRSIVSCKSGNRLNIFIALLVASTCTFANTKITSEREDAERTFSVPPKGEQSLYGLTVVNPDEARTLTINLRCIETEELGKVELDGSTTFFRFTVENVTKECPGFEIRATFDSPKEPETAYQIGITTAGVSPQSATDPSIFVFNPVTGNWAEAQGGGKPSEPGKAFATLTDSYNKVIAGIISYPDALSQNPSSITPKSLLSAIESPDATTGFRRIEPPSANSQGTASVEFPMMLRPARSAVPQAKISYSTTRGVGLLGQGWDLTVPEISVETVSAPFSNNIETEDYTFNGHLLFPMSPSGSFSTPNKRGGILRARNSEGFREYRLRDIGSGLIFRRHGTQSSTYYWEVYDPHTAQTSIYGANPFKSSDSDTKNLIVDNSAVERGGNASSKSVSQNSPISKWMLTQVFDNQPVANETLYQYVKRCGNNIKITESAVIDCVPTSHIPLLDKLTYNETINAPANISANQREVSWKDGVSHIDFEYVGREKIRSRTHGRFGALITNQAFLKNVAVRYDSTKLGESILFSQHQFILDDGKNEQLNYRHHLMRVVVKANEDESLFPVKARPQKTSYTDDLREQVYAFSYKQSERSPEWAETQGILNFVPCGLTPEIYRPRILKDLLGRDSLGNVTCPAVLGTSLSKDTGGSVHVAAGTGADVTSKLQTVGVKVSVTDSDSVSQSSIVDINGDGLPDFVFITENNKTKYCPGERDRSSIYELDTEEKFNQSIFDAKEVLGIHFSKDCHPIFKGESGEHSLAKFSESSSFTFSVSPELHTVESIFSGVNFSQSSNRNSIYLSDVDGDGLLDLVENMQVYYNLGESKSADGTPVKSIRFVLNKPLIPSLPLSDDVDLPSSAELAPPYLSEVRQSLMSEIVSLEQQLTVFPRAEPVVMWRAPATGHVALNGLLTGITLDTQVTVYRDDGQSRLSCAVAKVNTNSALVVSQMNRDANCNTIPDPARLLERFSPLNEKQIEDMLLGAVFGPAFPPESTGDSSALLLRVEENDVLELVVEGTNVEEVSANINVQYQLIDWDESYNASQVGLALPYENDSESQNSNPAMIAAALAQRAPAVSFNAGTDSAIDSGMILPVQIPEGAQDIDFRIAYKFNGIEPSVALETLDTSGQVDATRVLGSDTEFCSVLDDVDNYRTVRCEVSQLDSVFTSSNFHIRVIENERRAESKLLWITPPHIRFRNAGLEQVARMRVSEETLLLEAFTRKDGFTADNLIAKLVRRNKRIATADQIDNIHRSQRIILPLNVHRPLYKLRKQRIDNEVFFPPIGRVVFLDDEFFRNVNAERSAEDEVLDKLCANLSEVLDELREAISQHPDIFANGVCVDANVANFTLDINGIPEDQLLAVKNELVSTLKIDPNLFYDQSLLSRTGFRLPVKTNPVTDCGGDSLCTYSLSMNLRDTITLPRVADQNGNEIPLSFNLRLRLFVDGIAHSFTHAQGDDQLVVTIQNGNSPELEPIIFQAKPGQLLYVQIFAEPLIGQSNHEPLIMAIQNRVFGISELTLSTQTGDDGYDSFMCRDNFPRDRFNNCDRRDRRAFRLQAPVYITDAPQTVLSSLNAGVINNRLLEFGLEQSPTFSFDHGGWAVPFVAEGGAFSSSNAVQFPNINFAQNNQCTTAIQEISIDPKSNSVPKENPIAGDCPINITANNLVTRKRVKYAPLSSARGPWPSEEDSYSKSLEGKVDQSEGQWAWAYFVDDPDLIAFTDPIARDKLKMRFGRVGPDKPISDSLLEIDSFLSQLDELESNVVPVNTTYGNGKLNRARGRPSSSGEKVIPLHAPIQTSTSRTLSATLPTTPVATAVISKRETTANFLDINGDGFPEFIGKSGAGTLSSPVGVPRPLWYKAFAERGAEDTAIGGTGFKQNGLALSVNLGLGAAPPTAGQFLTRLVNMLTPGEVEGNFSVSLDASVGGGFNQSNIAFADFNGDGLVDRYTEKSIDRPMTVGLNIGGRAFFANGFDDLIGDVQKSVFDRFGTLSSTGFGINLGYSNGNNSLSGGLGTGFQASGSYFSFMDFTADGLVDLVLPYEEGLVVVPNLGNGFNSNLIRIHRIPGFSFNQTSASESVYTDIGGNITGGVTALGLKATITVGVKDAESYSRTLVQIRDLNADGVPDIAQEKSFFQGIDPLVGLPPVVDDFLTGLPDIGNPDGVLRVHYNPEGQVGLLSSITQPTGGQVRMDYALVGNTGPSHGRAVWSLARVEAEDTYQPLIAKVSPNEIDEFPVDGDDVAGQVYRYHQGHYNRAEKAFYGFSQVLRDDYGRDCVALNSCSSAPVRLLRRTAQNFDNNNYFSRGSLTSEWIGDSVPLRRDIVGFEAQAISNRREAYSIYDFSCDPEEKKCIRDRVDPWTLGGKDDSFLGYYSDLRVRESGNKPDIDLFTQLETKDNLDPLSIKAIDGVINELQENSVSLGAYEYEHAFDSYLGSSQSRLSLLAIYGQDATVNLPPDGLPMIVGDPLKVVSAQGRDIDQWGQPITFYDIGRVTQSEESQEIETVRSLRAEIKYAEVEARKKSEGTHFPFLGRNASLRVTRGLQPREPIFAEDNFLRSRQATYENGTGNLLEICAFDVDVRPTMCREYVNALDASVEADPQDRLGFALASVAIKGERIIHTRVADYDGYGNVVKTLSPLNHGGEWVTREFDYKGDPFRSSPSRIALTRCLRGPAHGASTPESGPAPVCEYGRASSKESGAPGLIPIRHRSLSVIDRHFGGESVKVDINNNAILTERDRWGRPTLVARNFGDSNSGSGRVAPVIERAKKRHALQSQSFWSPVLELEYISKVPAEKEMSVPADSLFRARSFKYVGGEFYRGLQDRERTLGAVVSYSLADSSGKTIQKFQESEVCLTPSLNINDEKGNFKEPQFPSLLSSNLKFTEEYAGGSPVLGQIDIPDIPANQEEFARKARSSELCAEFDEYIVQPGAAIDALGREISSYEPFSGSRKQNDDHIFQRGFSELIKLDVLAASQNQKLSLIPIQSSIYDSADRPLLVMQRLGRLALHSESISSDVPSELVLKSAANSLDREDVKKKYLASATSVSGADLAGLLGFTETAQYNYLVQNSNADNGRVFSSTHMDSRCAISRTAFDSRGLARRVAQRHDTFSVDESNANNEKRAAVFELLGNGNSARLSEPGGPSNVVARTKELETRGATNIAFTTYQAIRDLGSKLTLRDGTSLGEFGFEPKVLEDHSIDAPTYDLTTCAPIIPEIWSFGRENDIEDSDISLGSENSDQTISYEYDSLRQLRSVYLPKPGVLSTNPSLNESIGMISLEYDGFGRRISIDDVNTGVSEYSYDDLNSVVSERSSRPSGRTETVKRYHYAADRLERIEYQSDLDQSSSNDLTSREDAADTVLFFHDAAIKDLSRLSTYLTDEAASGWLQNEVLTTGCANCIGQVSMIKDRTGVKVNSYNALGQVEWMSRSIVHPLSRVTNNYTDDREIGRFKQRNLYTSFGDLVSVDLDDLKPAEAAENCLLNGSYICGGRINLSYKHTPDGNLSNISYSNGNQKIQSIAYDALSRPYLRLSGDLTRNYSYFDAIDLKLNYSQTRTAVGSFVQNLVFDYERGGNVLNYMNLIPAYVEQPAPAGYTSNYSFDYDTSNRLIGVSAKINTLRKAPEKANASAAYWYDDANRFYLRSLNIRQADALPINRKWRYSYPTGDNLTPRHAPHRVSFSLDPTIPDKNSEFELPSFRDSIGQYLERSNTLGLIISTSFDDLGRMSSIANRELAIGDPEEQALTPRQLFWDAEDRLRRVRTRLRSSELDADKFDTDPTGEITKYSNKFPKECDDSGSQGSANRLRCTEEDVYSYDFGSNRTVKISSWPTQLEDEPSSSQAITLYVTPFYSRGYDNRGNVLIAEKGKQIASIDVPFGNFAAAPGVTYTYSDLPVGSTNASVVTNGEPGIDIPTVSRREYSPYGYSISKNRFAELREKNSELGIGQSRLYSFHGKQLDASTGFSSFGARYYSRDLGIWLSADPAMPKILVDPQNTPTALASISAFGLNPISYVDRNGLEFNRADASIAHDNYDEYAFSSSLFNASGGVPVFPTPLVAGVGPAGRVSLDYGLTTDGTFFIKLTGGVGMMTGTLSGQASIGSRYSVGVGSQKSPLKNGFSMSTSKSAETFAGFGLGAVASVEGGPDGSAALSGGTTFAVGASLAGYQNFSATAAFNPDTFAKENAKSWGEFQTDVLRGFGLPGY